jgi:hypothetical protein
VNGATRKPDEFTILDHVESPYHRGRAPNASCAHAQRNAACGDWVRLERSVVSGQWSVVSGQWSVVASPASTDE